MRTDIVKTIRYTILPHWRVARTRLSPHYALELRAALGDASTVLDVGCGSHSPIRLFGDRLEHTVGVDGFEPAIEASRAARIHDEYRLLDVRRLREAFAPCSFDAVLAVDVLEHLTREEGFALLTSMEEIARRRVVVFTPNGHVPQDAVAGNPLQVHRSGWTANDLRLAGFDVIGLHGLRHLRLEEAALRWRPRRLWRFVSDLSEPLVRHRPSLAYHLLGVKPVGGQS